MDVKNEVSDLIIPAIASGITWDCIKSGMQLTLEDVKKSMLSWILDDIDYERIAKLINKMPDEHKKKQKIFEAYLDDNNEIKEILSKAKSDNKNIITNNTGQINIASGNAKVDAKQINYNKNNDNNKKK